MGLGSIVIYLKPPGSAARGENWGTCVLAASLVTTGGFAMAEGLIINIVPGGGATVLKALGLFVAVAVAYQCYRRRERRLAEQGSPLTNPQCAYRVCELSRLRFSAPRRVCEGCPSSGSLVSWVMLIF